MVAYISGLALVLSCISLLWQILGRVKNIKIEVVDIFESIGERGMQYIFRINIYNLAYSSIGISNIDIIVKDTRLSFDYQSHALAINSAGLVPEDVIRSKEFPFKVDAGGANGGYIYILDSENVLDLVQSPVSALNFELKTNRGIHKARVQLPQVRPIDDLAP